MHLCHESRALAQPWLTEGEPRFENKHTLQENHSSKLSSARQSSRHRKTLLNDTSSDSSQVSEEPIAPKQAHDKMCKLENAETAHGRTRLLNHDCTIFNALLQTCAKNKDLYLGTQLHNDIVKKGLLESCSDALVCMYANCGDLSKAHDLLDTHKSRNVFCWTSLIAGYAKQGQDKDSLKCFDHMLQEGLSPDPVTYACIVRVCGRLKAVNKGKQIHDLIAQQGLLKNHVLLGNALINMYANCGALAKAHLVLEDLLYRDVVSWNSLIAGYVQQGHGEHAMACLEQMQFEGLSPDEVTFVCILKACGILKAIDKGEEVHYELSRRGLLMKDVILGNALVDMYVKCRALVKAQDVVDALPSRNVVTWTTLIAGYAEEGQGRQALSCYERMQFEGVSPNAKTFASILKACGSINDVKRGEQIHYEIARQGLLGKDVVLGNALVDMYAKFGALSKAAQVFEELPFRDIVSWNALMSGYIQHSEEEKAFNCLEKMRLLGISPNVVTFICLLKACGSLGVANDGEQIHREISRRGMMRNSIELGNAVVDMYAKCGELVKARQVLKELTSTNIASWNALIAGYTQQGHGDQALICFQEMQYEGLSPNVTTYTHILKACAIVGAIDKGEQIHDETVKHGLLKKHTTLGNAVVDMYAKCGALGKAQRVLEVLPSCDVVSWSSLIGGYVQQGQGEQAFDCFERMQHVGISPDKVTFTCILRACSILEAVDKGKQIHVEIIRQGLLGSDLVLGNALIDMYAKCGALAQAQEVLEHLPCRDVVSWNALITGYAQQGKVKEALICFEELQDEGLSPNAVTFSCVLNACSHLGLVEDGYDYFVSMSTKFGIKPDIEHYSTIVDLFGRTGHLDKVVEMIQEIPTCDSSAVWLALLSACQRWGDVNIGRWAFEGAVKVDRSNSAAYVLMGNIYATAGMQEDAEDIERRLKTWCRECSFDV